MSSLSAFQKNQNQTVKVIDDVLKQILGQQATQVLYKYLKNNYSIEKHEIAEKLDSLDTALKESLGAGAVLIEKTIIQSIDAATAL